VAITQIGLPKPYYQEELTTQYCSDALTVLRELESDSVDLLCTDPPYGIGFMGKDWDKALPDKEIWAECLRVLKPGSFGFVMSIPRADCLSRMIISLEGAGFRVDFSPIYWAYASGFPKAQNIGKAIDKRLGVYKEGDLLPSSRVVVNENNFTSFSRKTGTNPQSPQAKALDGSYGGFQPKPAVEVIIVCMKPLSEKTFVDQALKNQKGITWLDDCRIPYENEADIGERDRFKGLKILPQEKGWNQNDIICNSSVGQSGGRFPANLLVSDDVLNDGRDHKVAANKKPTTGGKIFNNPKTIPYFEGGVPYNDSGSFSRYFDLDKWAQKTFPFLITPKASKSEKNKGLDMKLTQTHFLQDDGRDNPHPVSDPRMAQEQRHLPTRNHHPSVKPVKLMSYLITLGSREGDIVLDPFMGSGTTGVACQLLSRKFIGIDNNEEYSEIAAKRCSQSVMRLEI